MTTLPRPKKSRVVKSRLEVVLIAFFDNKGLIRQEVIPNGQTVNSGFHIEVLKRLRNSIRQKRPENM